VSRLLNVHRYRFRKGGAEAVFLDHMELFGSRGWSCAEFVMDHPRNGPSAWSRYFPPYFDPATAPRSVGTLHRFVSSATARNAMARLLDDFQPDIVHIHGLYQQLTPSVLQPIASRKIPIVYTVHDYKLLCPAYLLYTDKLGVCERCADGAAWNAAVFACLHGSRAVSAVYAAEALYHRWRDGERDSVQLLEAYAFQLDGVIQLYEATLEPKHLDFAIALAEAMIAKFHDPENGGFWQSAAASKDLIVRMKDDYDGAEPSGNSVATLALLKRSCNSATDATFSSLFTTAS